MPVIRRAALAATATVATVAALLVAGAIPAAAHEAWFVHHPEQYALDWSALLRPLTLGGIALACAVALAWRVAASRLPQPELPTPAWVQRLVPYVPRLLAAHLGAALLLMSFARVVLDPLAGVSGAGLLLLVPQLVVGALLLLGVAVRAAALGVVLAGPVLVALTGPRALLVSAVLVGIAGFLLVLPPRRRDGGRARVDAAVLGPAALLLRVGAAVSLITLAVVEKLANPAMGVAMIEQQPLLNLLAPVGASAETFVLLAGCVELLFGLLVLSGAAPQVVGLVAAVPFTAGVGLFGFTELMGHLPVYGVLLALVVLGSRAETSTAVSGLPGRGRRVAA